MLTAFRASVIALLQTELVGVPVYGTIPDDLNEVPCVIVGYPETRSTATRVVFDLDVEVLVIGRRVQAGDADTELTDLADAVWLALNGTRAVKHAAYSLQAQTLAPRTYTIAGVECPSYVIAVNSSIATC